MKDLAEPPTSLALGNTKAGASLSVEGVSWSARRKGKKILHPISFALLPRRVLGVVGPNGSGKTTLLRLLYRFRPAV